MLMIIITGGIDLSVGSYVCICVCLTAGFIQNGMGPMAIAAVGGLGILFGCVTGVLVAYAKVAPFIVTLAMTSILDVYKRQILGRMIRTSVPIP